MQPFLDWGGGGGGGGGGVANAKAVSLLGGWEHDLLGNFEIWDLPDPQKCNQVY
jgi:hypothetical protein